MKIEHNILLSPLTTFGIGGKARYFCRAQSGDDLIKAAQFAKENHLTLLVLGGGSNVLFPNEGFEGLVMKIEMLGIGWALSDNDLTDQMLSTLKNQILPLYYKKNAEGVPEQWVTMMRNARELIKNEFSMTRALKQYLEFIGPLS